MKYVVAVSGGVDSVVLLDKLTKQYKPDELVVAHFDHGIRQDSAEDATFVKSLAEKYGVAYETKREELGENASEELARNRRYVFLRDVAQKYRGTIVTAHHADDVVETIAINLIRGTGWRGLAVLDSPDIKRPLLDSTKADLVGYAKKCGLEWREDSTNQDTRYLRNDVRQKLEQLDGQTRELLRLYRNRQVVLRQMVDNEINTLKTLPPYSRHLFIVAPEAAALELLRSVFIRETGQGLIRPQLERALHAIKTLHAGKVFEAGDGAALHFTKTHFIVRRDDRVV